MTSVYLANAEMMSRSQLLQDQTPVHQRDGHSFRKSNKSPLPTTILQAEAPGSFITGRLIYYILSSILTIGIMMLILIPLGSTFLYIDYKQQLAQRKSNKNELCKSKCSYGAECVVDEYSGQSYCRCPLRCPDDYQPVCGSDGITYINMCHLNYESCNKQQVITVAANNTCDATLCRTITCQRYQSCQVDDKGKARCVCTPEIICPSHQHEQPVCGSNGRLYSSLCELRKHACFYNLDIVSVHLDSCTRQQNATGDTAAATVYGSTVMVAVSDNLRFLIDNQIKCGNQVCGPYGECHRRRTVGNNQTSHETCQCPVDCSQDTNGPICATNKQNYVNECQMRKEACLRQIELKVLHRGQCGQCNSQCLHYAKCKLNDQNIPECVCPQVCIREDLPVCGDNGITYENECELQVSACRLQQKISVQFNGSCDLCHNVVCNYGATCVDGECVCSDNCQSSITEPLCANDGNNYRNECEMNRMACNNKMELIALFYGKCEETNDNYDDDYTPNGVEPLSVTGEDQTKQQCLLAMNEACAPGRFDDDYVYICENEIFHSKCKMLRKKCTSQPLSLCTNHCQCNKYGLDQTGKYLCDPLSNQCICKDGVTGNRCDKCDAGYWNFRQLRACNCSPLGSSHNECNKFNGKCKCKSGVKGLKCDRCPPNTHLTIKGCVGPEGGSGRRSCSSIKCHHGSICKENGSHAYCYCSFNCKQDNDGPVCASDGTRHVSMCHFRKYMCQMQKKIQILKHCPQ